MEIKEKECQNKKQKRTYLRCNVMVLYKYIVNYYHNYSIIIIDIKAGMRRCLSMAFYCISVMTMDAEHHFTNLFSSVQFSHSFVSDSLWPHESQHARTPCPSPSPGVHSDPRPLSSDAIQPSHPRSSPSPPAPNPSQHQSLFQWVNSSHEVAKVLKLQL